VARKPRRIKRAPLRQIEKPIHVFISSSQREFSSIRKKLQARIDVLRIEGSKIIFVADLVEKKHGESIQSDINNYLNLASVYVAIIGDKNSKWTMEEFDEAWMRGIPVLIYDYRKRKSRTPISLWLDGMVERGIRVEVPETPYQNAEDLINHIIDDLPDKLGELAEKYQQVRNIVSRKGSFGSPRR